MGSKHSEAILQKRNEKKAENKFLRLLQIFVLNTSHTSKSGRVVCFAHKLVGGQILSTHLIDTGEKDGCLHTFNHKDPEKKANCVRKLYKPV